MKRYSPERKEAAIEDEALLALDQFGERWDEKYP